MTENPNPFGPLFTRIVIVYGVLPFTSPLGLSNNPESNGLALFETGDCRLLDDRAAISSCRPVPSRSLSSTTTRSSSISGSVGTVTSNANYCHERNFKEAKLFAVTDGGIVEINVLLDCKVSLTSDVGVQQSVPSARVLRRNGIE